MNLSDTEKKILLLAMDREAANGEMQAAAIKLIELFRKRYTSGHELIKDLEQLPREVIKYRDRGVIENPYGDFKMPFGKHKGKQLRQIPVDYLLWVVENCEDMRPHTCAAIECWLQC